MYLGGEKLKLFVEKFRFLRVACLCLLIFSVNVFYVFAQAETGEDLSADAAGEVSSEAVDPILAAERALTLDEPADAGDAPVPASSSAFAVFRMILVLILAAAAIYGVVYIFKRASRRIEVKDPFLKVLASAPLGSGRYAHVVSLGSKAWLIGASDGGVNLIGEINDKDTLDAMFLEDSRKSAEAGPGRFLDFKSMLRRLGMPVQTDIPGADNIRKRRERLKGL